MNLLFKIKCFIFASLLFLSHVGAAKEILLNAVPLTMPQHLMRHYCFMSSSKKDELFVGQRFGLFTIKSIYSVNTKTAVDVICDCGEERTKLATVLRHGRVTSCGCINKKPTAGVKFGNVTVLTNPSNRYVIGRCDCGVEKKFPIGNLRNGRTKSCGCLCTLVNQAGLEYNGFTIKKDFENSRPREVLASCPLCGEEKIYPLGRIRNGSIKSCMACKDFGKLNRNSQCFSDINESTMYWAGFIASDGNIHNDSLCIGLHAKDSGHIEKFKQFTGSEHKIYKTDKKCVLKFIDKDICSDLSKFGITERKSLTYEVPIFCLNDRHFWRGMVDGDGCVCLRGKHASVSIIGTRSVVQGFLDFAKSICGTKTNPCKRPGSENTYTAALSCRNARLVLTELYGGNPKYFLDRKYEKAMSII